MPWTSAINRARPWGAGHEDPRHPGLPWTQPLLPAQGHPPARRPRRAGGVSDRTPAGVRRPASRPDPDPPRAHLFLRGARRLRPPDDRGRGDLARPRPGARRDRAAVPGRHSGLLRQDAQPRPAGRPVPRDLQLRGGVGRPARGGARPGADPPPAAPRARAGRPGGQYRVICSYGEESVGLRAGELALELILHLLPPERPAHDPAPFDFAAELERFIRLAQRRAFGPSTASLVNAAEQRAPPARRA